MDVLSVCPTPEDIVKYGIYQEVNKSNPGLDEENPSAYFRKCKEIYERVHIDRLSAIKKVIKHGLDEFITNGLKKHSKNYHKLTTKEQKKRDRKAFSLVSKTCCKNTGTILKYWREYNNMRKTN